MNPAMITKTFEQGGGILQLIPVFVPRRFGKPGYRLRLHPDDYYAYGMHRGAIKERWLSSVIPAMNGDMALPDEGMSYVLPCTKRMDDAFVLKDAVDVLAADLIGEGLWETYGNWPMYAKFFDYMSPLFHHLHLDDEAASRVGSLAKPEAYYFPPQMNNHPGDFPVTYFGFDPSVRMEEVKERLLQFDCRDNRVTELSRAFRIELGTGWYTPPGVVHAPGSCLTYEPQWNSDVNSVYENTVAGEILPRDFLVENCPEDRKNDIEYVLSLMDWEKNVDPRYREKYFRPPRVRRQAEGHVEKWIVYANDYFGATELTIAPGQTVRMEDPVAYGCILLQGFGSMGAYHAEAAHMLRFGQTSADEFFVGEQAAREGVEIANHSRHEPMVILKHFAPNHPDMPASVEGKGHEDAI